MADNPSFNFTLYIKIYSVSNREAFLIQKVLLFVLKKKKKTPVVLLDDHQVYLSN